MELLRGNFEPDFRKLYDVISGMKGLVSGYYYLSFGSLEDNDTDYYVATDHPVCALGALISNCSLVAESIKNTDIEFEGDEIHINNWDEHKTNDKLVEKVNELIKTGFFIVNETYYEQWDDEAEEEKEVAQLCLTLTFFGSRIMGANDQFKGNAKDRKEHVLSFIREQYLSQVV